MSAENSANFEKNFGTPTKQARLGLLILGLRSKYADAYELQTEAKTDSVRKHGVSPARRHILRDIKGVHIPIETTRLTLGSKDGRPMEGVGRLVVRRPDTEVVTLPRKHPNDMFTELQYTSGRRQRFLLNGTGLWEYEGADKLSLKTEFRGESDNDIYFPREVRESSIALLGLLERVQSAFVPQDLLGSETEIA